MIRIDLKKENKDEIERLVIKYLSTDKVGLINALNPEKNKQNVLKLKEQCNRLYSILFDCNDKLKKAAVKELMLADRKTMEHLILKVGDIDDDNIKFIQKIFNFNYFSRNDICKKIIRLMNVSVCPYCNRQYVTTLKNGKVRAQIDHYFCKSKYPYLSLSVYNFIPCCDICNKAKSNSDMMLTEKRILYPIDEEMGENGTWYYEEDATELTDVNSGISDKFEIKININNKTDCSVPINNQVNMLKLQELYGTHKDYVRDIIRAYYINPKSRIKELSMISEGLQLTEREVERLVFMTYLDKEDWGKRPLSKLTHDIVKQLKEM